jgi:hypothetical protein
MFMEQVQQPEEQQGDFKWLAAYLTGVMNDCIEENPPGLSVWSGKEPPFLSLVVNVLFCELVFRCDLAEMLSDYVDELRETDGTIDPVEFDGMMAVRNVLRAAADRIDQIVNVQ